jgi:hypothetical protein
MLNAERETPNACPNVGLSEFILTEPSTRRCVKRYALSVKPFYLV